METIWDTIQNVGKWWSKKQRESEERLEQEARRREMRILNRYPNWEGHRG